MKEMAANRVLVTFFILLGLLVLNLAPLAHAGVGLEYLGPNPLRPEPINGRPNTLGAGAIVGNTGNANATITFTLLADQKFNSQFTYSITGNNSVLGPSTRENFALIFTFNPNTISVQDYNAAIKIVASPTTTSGTSGSASFDLAVAIPADVLSSNYNGVQVTLTTATGILTMTTPSAESAMTPQAQTNVLSTNSASTNSVYSTNSTSIDPNLLGGIAIGAIVVLTGFFLFRRKSKGLAKSQVGAPVKATVERSCIRCGTALRADDRFCDACGSRQDS